MQRKEEGLRMRCSRERNLRNQNPRSRLCNSETSKEKDRGQTPSTCKRVTPTPTPEDTDIRDRPYPRIRSSIDQNHHPQWPMPSRTTGLKPKSSRIEKVWRSRRFHQRKINTNHPDKSQAVESPYWYSLALSLPPWLMTMRTKRDHYTSLRHLSTWTLSVLNAHLLKPCRILIIIFCLLGRIHQLLCKKICSKFAVPSWKFSHNNKKVTGLRIICCCHILMSWMNTHKKMSISLWFKILLGGRRFSLLRCRHFCWTPNSTLMHSAILIWSSLSRRRRMRLLTNKDSIWQSRNVLNKKDSMLKEDLSKIRKELSKIDNVWSKTCNKGSKRDWELCNWRKSKDKKNQTMRWIETSICTIEIGIRIRLLLIAQTLVSIWNQSSKICMVLLRKTFHRSILNQPATNLQLNPSCQPSNIPKSPNRLAVQAPRPIWSPSRTKTSLPSPSNLGSETASSRQVKTGEVAGRATSQTTRPRSSSCPQTRTTAPWIGWSTTRGAPKSPFAYWKWPWTRISCSK